MLLELISHELTSSRAHELTLGSRVLGCLAVPMWALSARTTSMCISGSTRFVFVYLLLPASVVLFHASLFSPVYKLVIGARGQTYRGFSGCAHLSRFNEAAGS